MPDPEETAARRERLRRQFLGRGPWPAEFDALVALDPDFLEAYLRFAAVPWRSQHLDPKVKELIYVAVDASITHRYEPGLRMHIPAALRAGATPAEIVRACEIASLAVLDSLAEAVPVVLQEVAAAVGQREDEPVDLRTLAPELFAASQELASRPGVLGTKVEALIAFAVAASPAQPRTRAMRAHLVRALAQGATAGQVVEVLGLVSAIGIHACTVAGPHLLQSLGAVDRLGAAEHGLADELA